MPEREPTFGADDPAAPWAEGRRHYFAHVSEGFCPMCDAAVGRNMVLAQPLPREPRGGSADGATPMIAQLMQLNDTLAAGEDR